MILKKIGSSILNGLEYIGRLKKKSGSRVSQEENGLIAMLPEISEDKTEGLIHKNNFKWLRNRKTVTLKLWSFCIGELV